MSSVRLAQLVQANINSYDEQLDTCAAYVQSGVEWMIRACSSSKSAPSSFLGSDIFEVTKCVLIDPKQLLLFFELKCI